MKPPKFLALLLLLALSCVGPPEPIDGLIEDLPAVVNTDNVFSFTLKGNRFTFDERFILSLKLDSTSVLNTTLTVTDFTGTDTVFITVKNETDSVLNYWEVTSDWVEVRVDSLSADATLYPKKVLFQGQDFKGVLQYLLVKK